MQDWMEKRQKNRIILSYRYSGTRFRRKKVGSSHTDILNEGGNSTIFKIIHSIDNAVYRPYNDNIK